MIQKKVKRKKRLIKKHKTLIFTIIVLVFIAACLYALFEIQKVHVNTPTQKNANTNTYIEPTAAKTADNTKEIINLTNAERIKVGLPPLKENSKLDLAAQNKAQNAITNNYWAHFAPDGTSPWSFIINSGYSYSYAGENLAKGFTFASNVVNSWMNSPEHKANILSEKFTEIGVGVLRGKLQGEQTILVVQMFGTPQTQGNNYAAPSLDINNIQTYLNNLNSSRSSWANAKGNMSQEDLRNLLDSLDRQIAFCNTLVTKLSSGQSPTQDDVNLWNGVLKMSNESAALSNKLNSSGK